MNIIFLGNFHVDFSSENHHKKSLESLGHKVIPLQEGVVNADVIMAHCINADLLIWVHTHGWNTPNGVTFSREDILSTLKSIGIPSLTYHLDLWLGIARQKDLDEDPFYKDIEHFFTVDKLMADWFNKNTKVKGHYIPAGVFGEECKMLEPNQEPMNDVIFVGSRGYHPEWKWRPTLIDWLAETYGDKFKHFGGDGIKIVRGHELNQLYANTKVVVGDSLVLNFDYPYYWSDRVYETMGRGGFLLMPNIAGLENEFELGVELDTFEFGNFYNIKKQIDFYLKNNELREVMRKNGHNKVKNNYTYKHRWETILNQI